MLFELDESFNETSFRRKYYKFLRQNILFDTGPLFLYLIGSYDAKNGTSYLQLFNDYSQEDFKILERILALFKKEEKHFIITSQILFEVARHVQYDIKKAYPNDRELLNKISNFISPSLKKMGESHSTNNQVVGHNGFITTWKLGNISIDIVDKLDKNCGIILSDNQQLNSKYSSEDNSEVLLLNLRYIINNSAQFRQ